MLVPRSEFLKSDYRMLFEKHKAEDRRHRDAGSIPGSGRSPGGGNGNPLWYSCLGNPMNTGVWSATVHRVVKNWTQLSDGRACP